MPEHIGRRDECIGLAARVPLSFPLALQSWSDQPSIESGPLRLVASTLAAIIIIILWLDLPGAIFSTRRYVNVSQDRTGCDIFFDGIAFDIA